VLQFGSGNSSGVARVGTLRLGAKIFFRPH